MMKRLKFTRAIFICLLLINSTSLSHTKSESYSNWIISQDNILATITIPLYEVTRLPGIQSKTTTFEELFLKHTEESIKVRTQKEDCQLISSQKLNATEGFVRIEMSYDCNTSNLLMVDYRAIFDFSPSHMHFAKIYKKGILISELLVNNATETWKISTSESQKPNSNVLQFFKLGVDHISGGYDHIAFLMGILLVAGTITRSIIAVSGFTIGHSLSLFAATVGIIESNSKIVEVFIGYTIALMAVEYVNKKSDKYQKQIPILFALILLLISLLGLTFGNLHIKSAIAYLGLSLFTYCYLNIESFVRNIKQSSKNYLLLCTTLIFGLLHGLGFAGFLKDSGIDNENILLPLLSFNIGLEFGQLCIIFFAWLILFKTKNYLKEPLPSVASGGLFGVGFYWMILRTFS